MKTAGTGGNPAVFVRYRTLLKIMLKTRKNP
jgi:hypothetical protein